MITGVEAVLLLMRCLVIHLGLNHSISKRRETLAQKVEAMSRKPGGMGTTQAVWRSSSLHVVPSFRET